MSVCECCGREDDAVAALVAVSDVLVVKALERVGHFLVREERGRHAARGTTPYHLLHTLWPVPDAFTTKALRGAWDVVPPLLAAHHCTIAAPERVIHVLNAYVHDLVLTGTPHSLDELRFRFAQRLTLVEA